jgi:DNA-binding PadR family transcriptional regulator
MKQRKRLKLNNSHHIVHLNYMAIELGIWEIAVLSLLREGPMHPYQMQRLLRMRHKDEILALKRGSLYHAIGRLLKADFIAVEGTGRNGRRPERTTYRLTEAGEQGLVEKLQRMIAEPRQESSEFMAAMSFLVHLPAAEAAEKLEDRARALETRTISQAGVLAGASAFLPRIHLIESEYLVAMLKAELAWVRELGEDLRAGRLNWNIEEVLAEAQAERIRADGPKSKAERTEP